MGWALFDTNTTTKSWFIYVCTIRNYMFIMKYASEPEFKAKVNESISTYADVSMDSNEMRKRHIRRTYEIISILTDKVLDRPVYDLFQRR